MGFRRDGRLEHRWKRWVKEHQTFLSEECGLPSEIIRDREEWFHFLDHSYSRSVEIPRLSGLQMERLVSFIEESEGSEFGPISSLTRFNFTRTLFAINRDASSSCR